MSKNLTNLITPSVYKRYVSAALIKSNAFVLSGAAIALPALSNLLAGAAAQFNLPYWKNISTTGVTPSSDPASLATAQRMSAGSQIALRVPRNITPVSVADLEAMIIGEDPVAEALAQVVTAHATIRQKTALDMLTAITTLDGADSGTAADLTYVSAATAGSASLIAEAVANMWGDSIRGLVGLTLVMNGIEYLDFQKDQLTYGGNVQLKNAVDVGFGTVSGATIVVDDDVPANTIFVVRPGGMAFGSASVDVPFEIERSASGGTGGGVSTLHSRDLYSFHIAGASFTGSFTTGAEVATDADIALATNWSLTRLPKYMGVMAITHA